MSMIVLTKYSEKKTTDFKFVKLLMHMQNYLRKFGSLLSGQSI